MTRNGRDEIAALRHELEGAARRGESLRRVIESISGELALEPLLTRIVESAAELLGSGYGSIGLVEERGDAQVVRIAAIYRMPPQELGAIIPCGRGLAGTVLRERRTLLLARYGDLEKPTLPELAEHCVIGLPVWWGERMIGFFGMGVEPPRRFDERDAELLALFARHAAIAIENARLFEAERRRAARMAIIQRISRQITGSLDLNAIFQTTVEMIHQDLGFAYAAAGIIDPDDSGSLALLAQAGRYTSAVPPGFRQSIDVGLLGAAARSRRRVLVNNVAQDPRYVPIPGAGEICAELVIPILAGDRLIGVLNIESDRAISAEDAEGVEVVAGQLGVAMENAGLFARTERALAEAQMLYETSRRISLAMSVEAVVAAYLEQVATRGRYNCTVLVYDMDESGRRVDTIIRGFWSVQAGQRLATERYPYRPDPLDEYLDGGQTITMSDVHSDPRASESLRALQRRDGRPALAFIPLMVGSWRMGLVVLSYPMVHEWSNADLAPYQTTAALLAAAIASRQQEVQVAEQRRQVAVLEERRRLARELHDSVTQSLFSMSLLAQVLPDLWEIDQPEARGALGQIRDLTRSALAEMRGLLFELRPAALREQDLSFALREHASAFSQRTGIDVEVDIAGKGPLPEAVDQALFRIAQEALANVARHAHARSARVELRLGKPARLCVADDGRGFQPERVGTGGIGLTSMRERAAAIGASLRVRSLAERGTEIVVEWPA